MLDSNILKYVAFALALLIILEIPAVGQNFENSNHISFLPTPGINFSVNGVNTTLKFFTGGKVEIKGKMLNFSDTWHIKKNGPMNYTYYSSSIESISMNMPVVALNSNLIKVSLAYYLNDTIYIHPVSSNRIFNTSSNRLYSNNTNTLSITYDISAHRVISISKSIPFSKLNLSIYNEQDIIVPQIFYFGNGTTLTNVTMKENHSNYNGFSFMLGNTHKHLFYTFNRTYSNNGVPNNTCIIIKSISHTLLMGMVFTMNGNYANITYDPYVITPDISLLHFNITGPSERFINYILDNSVILIGGFTAGILIIGAGYISYRKRSKSPL